MITEIERKPLKVVDDSHREASPETICRQIMKHSKFNEAAQGKTCPNQYLKNANPTCPHRIISGDERTTHVDKDIRYCCELSCEEVRANKNEVATLTIINHPWLNTRHL